LRCSPTGAATSQSTSSQVVIQSYFSISLSGNLSEGVDFGAVTSLPATDLNATGNYNVTGNLSVYFITVSADSNGNVDFCIKADNLNTSAGDEIGLANYTWSNSTSNDISNPPGSSGSAELTTSYVQGSTVAPSGNIYYRFWLDIPSGQGAGTYNNTVYFKGKTTGEC
jgi:hypothetical protein